MPFSRGGRSVRTRIRDWGYRLTRAFSGPRLRSGGNRETAEKILFLTYLFAVATRFLASRLRALLLWESERENSHLKGFPFCGGTKFPRKVNILTSKRCSTN